MSLDVYSHLIVPDEVDPDVFKRLLSRAFPALERRPRDAPVMHGEGLRVGKPRICGAFL
jgi:hypothetical protein